MRSRPRQPPIIQYICIYRSRTNYKSGSHDFSPGFQQSFLCSVLKIVVCPFSFDHFLVFPFSIYDSVVFFVFLCDFGTISTVSYFLFFYQILELFRQCDICCFSIRLQNYFDIVVFFVFLLDFGTISTVWYLLIIYQILELF